MKILLLIFFSFLSISIYGQNNWQDGLKYGVYSIGYQTIQAKDYSRPYIMSNDSVFVPRPMQIGVWYPSEMFNEKNAITFGYLLSLEETEETLQVISLNEALTPNEKYKEYFKGDRIEEVFNKPMKSILDATQLSGSFPLILYGSSQSSSGYDNALLCEQLASHGYIVVTLASKGAYSRQMPFNEEGAEAQTRDLEFLYGHMYNFPNVDIKNIGTVSFSFGGLSTVIFSLKNKHVKAMVSLDGSVSVPSGDNILRSYDYLNVKSFNSDFLGFLGDKNSLDHFPLFDDASLSDIYLLKLKYLNHLDFSSANLTLTEQPDYVYKAYTDMANLTVRFMNQNFYRDTAFDEAINNYSKDIYLNLRQKKSKGSPKISKEEFINYIKEKGIDKGIGIYYETKREFPDYRLFDYDSFRDVGYLKMIERDFKNAVKVYKVLNEEFPNNPDSYRRLGEAFMENGNYEQARELINEGLKLDPDSPAMKDILRILNERDTGDK